MRFRRSTSRRRPVGRRNFKRRSFKKKRRVGARRGLRVGIRM